MRLSALFLAAVAACLVACSGDSGTPTAGTKPARKVTIGIVAKSQSNPVFQAAHQGARDAARDLGPKFGANVELSILTPADEDPQKQAQAVEQLASQGVDGIAVSCSNAATLQSAIDKAVDKGIPVMCFDSDSPKSKRFAYYGTDDAACGKRVGEELAKAMNNKGNVAILAGNESAPNLQARAQALRDEIATHPDMKVVGTFYHKETPEEAANAVNMQTTAHPEINGWGFIGGWPLFTRDALKWEPGQRKVVSVDGLPAMLVYLKDGHVDTLLAQDCYGWGSKSVEILLDKIVNKKDPPSVKVIDPLTKVTKENVDEFAKNWDKWLGK